MANDIGGVWRTIGGRRVFIKDGQDLSTAMKESGKFKVKGAYSKIKEEKTRDEYIKKSYEAYELNQKGDHRPGGLYPEEYDKLHRLYEEQETLKNKLVKSAGKEEKFTKSKKDDIIEHTNYSKMKSEDVAKNIKQSVKELEDKKYADGTYDVNTKKSVTFKDGYQATFQQLGDKYTDKELGDLIKQYSDSTDGKAYAGKFGGSPEVSFHFNSEEEAIAICEKFNQVSYWDWKKCKEVKNKKYKKGKGNDYA